MGWQRVPGNQPAQRPGDWNADGAHDVISRSTSDGGLRLYPGPAGRRPGAVGQIGNGWQLMPVVVASGDFDGDGPVDLVGRRGDGSPVAVSRRGVISPSSADRSWLVRHERSDRARRFQHRLAQRLAGPEGVGRVDLVARQPSGSMYLYPGNGVGRFRTPTKISICWAEFDLLILRPAPTRRHDVPEQAVGINPTRP